MYKYSERGVSKFFLIQLDEDQISALAEREGMAEDTFKNRYLYQAEDYYVAITEATYRHTVYSKPPEDGKLRKLKPAYSWLRLRDEILHPRINALNSRPISYKWVYASQSEQHHQ